MQITHSFYLIIAKQDTRVKLCACISNAVAQTYHRSLLHLDLLKDAAKVQLSACVSLFSYKALYSHSLGNVLRYALAMVQLHSILVKRFCDCSCIGGCCISSSFRVTNFAAGSTLRSQPRKSA